MRSRTFCRASIAVWLFVLVGCSGGTPALSPLPADATILAFGDSLTYGTGVAGEHSYPAVLAELTGRRVIRSGVPGEISAAGKQRLARLLEETRPDLVVLCHGGNDVLRRLNMRQTEQNLREMIGMIHATGAEVVLLAVPQVGVFLTPPDYYNAIHEELGVPVEFSILPTLQRDSAMKSDQVHFNVMGYRSMAEAVHALLIAEGALDPAP